MYSRNHLGNPTLQLLSTSSSDMANSNVECLREGSMSISSEPVEEHHILILAKPIHPVNSRFIPEPRVWLRNEALSSIAPITRAVVRVDLGVDKTIHQIDLVSSSAALLPKSFLGDVERYLAVEYQDANSHRLVLFLFIDISGRTMRLNRVEQVLPLCCCGAMGSTWRWGR